MLTVAALGGNALLRRGEPMDVDTQRNNIQTAAHALKPLFDLSRMVITHGNGPQVGLLALISESFKGEAPYPLDVLNAESEGMIGYLLEQEMINVLDDQHKIATLLTQVQVAAEDPAFQHPTKPIGPIYSQERASELSQLRGWQFAADGDSQRRVVPSPRPQRILEIDVIRLLLDSGVTVICTGGGGIPIVVDASGKLRGIEGVIDKDMASALLASELGADRLLLLTDVAAVYTNWGEQQQRAISTTHPDALSDYSFANGSMQPKVDAAIEFANLTGGIAGIGRLADASKILSGNAGTLVGKKHSGINWYQ